MLSMPSRRLCVNFIVVSDSTWTSLRTSNDFIFIDLTGGKTHSCVMLEVLAISLRCMKALDFRPICVRVKGQDAYVVHTSVGQSAVKYVSTRCIVSNSSSGIYKAVESHMRSKLFENSLGIA